MFQVSEIEQVKLQTRGVETKILEMNVAIIATIGNCAYFSTNELLLSVCNTEGTPPPPKIHPIQKHILQFIDKLTSQDRLVLTVIT